MTEKRTFHNLYLGLGSNLGDKGENIDKALNHIEERIGEIIATSAFYITEPIGFISNNQFLNSVCLVKTTLEPIEVLDITQSIEKEIGRTQKSKDGVYADRMIDIDLLLFDNDMIKLSRLTIPHIHLHERLFVLQPLSEIAGEHVHPILRKTINELKEELEG